MTSVETSKVALPNILCLHGFGQNVQEFYSKLCSLRSRYKKKFEFLILEAPHRLEDFEMDGKMKSNTFCWYYYNAEQKHQVVWKNVIGEYSTLIGLDSSMNVVQDTLTRNSDISHILGFSQGGSLLSIMCQKGLIQRDIKCVFVATFYPLNCSEIEDKWDYASQHVIGESDEVIAHSYSMDLASKFKNPLILTHKGRHVVPRFKLI